MACLAVATAVAWPVLTRHGFRHMARSPPRLLPLSGSLPLAIAAAAAWPVLPHPCCRRPAHPSSPLLPPSGPSSLVTASSAWPALLRHFCCHLARPPWPLLPPSGPSSHCYPCLARPPFPLPGPPIPPLLLLPGPSSLLIVSTTSPALPRQRHCLAHLLCHCCCYLARPPTAAAAAWPTLSSYCSYRLACPSQPPPLLGPPCFTITTATWCGKTRLWSCYGFKRPLMTSISRSDFGPHAAGPDNLRTLLLHVRCVAAGAPRKLPFHSLCSGSEPLSASWATRAR
jgi:hypothetical protein